MSLGLKLDSSDQILDDITAKTNCHIVILYPPKIQQRNMDAL